MGFNKRHLNYDVLISTSDKFKYFEAFLSSADSYICEDDISMNFYQIWMSVDSSFRKGLWNCLKENEMNFFRDYAKCIKIINGKGVENTESVEKYTKLFETKWGKSLLKTTGYFDYKKKNL